MPQSEGDKPVRLPYQIVDGFKIPAMFSVDVYRSGLHYRPREGDAFIVTFPKCGTTWMQNIVTCIFNGGRTFSSGIEFMTQSPFLELVGADVVEKMPRPGAIKCHLPFHLIPWSTEAKYIFVARNPKDACVSYYEYNVNLPMSNFEDGTFEYFFEVFIKGETDFGDYFDMLISWYERRDDPNVLFITYEELKKDIKTNVLKVAEFLGQEYKDKLESDPEVLMSVIQHSSFSFLKQHLTRCMSDLADASKDWKADEPDVPHGLKAIFSSKEDSLFNADATKNQFFRKGEVGDWKNYFTPEQDARLMQKFRERTKGTTIPELWEDVLV